MLKLIIPSVVSILVIFLQYGINDQSIQQATEQIDQYKLDSDNLIQQQLSLFNIDNIDELNSRVKELNTIDISGDDTIEEQVYDIINHFNIKDVNDIFNLQDDIIVYLKDKYGYDSPLIDNREFFVEDNNYSYNGYYVLNIDKISEYAENIENNNSLESNF